VPSGFTEVPVQATLVDARDPVSLGDDLAVRTSTLLTDGGQLTRVFAITPAADAGWRELASLELASNNTSGGLARRDGGLILVGTRDTVRHLDLDADGGWTLSPQLLTFPVGTSGERSRVWNAVTVLDDLPFIAGGEGAYALRQPSGEYVSTATQLNRNRNIGALCPGPSPKQPIAVSEGSVVLERQLSGTWRRYDLGGLSLATNNFFTSCASEPGRSVIAGPNATLLEYRGAGTVMRLDAGVAFDSVDGGQLTFSSVAFNRSGELFAVGLIGNGSSRVLQWRPGQNARQVFVFGEFVSGASVEAGNGSATWFVGPGGIALVQGDGGIGPAITPGGSMPVGVALATAGASGVLDGGTLGYAVGPRGATWRRPTAGGFNAIRPATQAQDFTTVWVAPTGDVFIGGSTDAGLPLPQPSVFLFRNDALRRVEPVPMRTRGPSGVTGFVTDAGTVEVFVAGDQGIILRKSFPADGGE
jgi:hypothetical protein